MTSDWGYLGKLPNYPDNLPARAGNPPICLAVAKGAIGDCTRAKGHDGPHQGAHGYAWALPVAGAR